MWAKYTGWGYFRQSVLHASTFPMGRRLSELIVPDFSVLLEACAGKDM